MEACDKPDYISASEPRRNYCNFPPTPKKPNKIKRRGPRSTALTAMLIRVDIPSPPDYQPNPLRVSYCLVLKHSHIQVKPGAKNEAHPVYLCIYFKMILTTPQTFETNWGSRGCGVDALAYFRAPTLLNWLNWCHFVFLRKQAFSEWKCQS